MSGYNTLQMEEIKIIKARKKYSLARMKDNINLMEQILMNSNLEQMEQGNNIIEIRRDNKLQEDLKIKNLTLAVHLTTTTTKQIQEINMK